MLIAIPAFSQQSDAPESLLPPGFSEPPPPAPPQPGNAVEPPPSAPPQPSADRPSLAAPQTPIADAADEDLEELQASLPPPIEIPAASRRPVDVVGVIGPAEWGMAPDAYRGANGRFLSTLMRRLDAPLPSRWTSILLRRALLSRTPAPQFVHPVDWVAERAWLLLRMGEADAARMLVQRVDVDRFTPKMFGVAVQTALATADPAALCPLVPYGRTLSDEPVWPLADAMCAALEGDSGRASALIDQARRRSRAAPIDVMLAEKVIGAGIDTRRAVSIEWEDVDELNSWRFGLAAATGVDIPEPLMGRAGLHLRAWKARASMLPIEQRTEAAEFAAGLGVYSNASLVQMYSLIADNTDPSDMAESVGGRLRRTYVAAGSEAKIEAMRSLWNEREGAMLEHARLVLTATAAARIQPDAALSEHAGRLIASMLTAGYDRRASRWSAVVEEMDDAESDRAWALLAIASPRPGVSIDGGRIAGFIDRDGSAEQQRSRLLVAALAGLGRLESDAAAGLAEDLGFELEVRNRWSVMLQRAAQRGQPGTVALLAAIGMQTGGWAGVPPAHLYQIVRALREVGREYEARMIAAEALTRL